ncbi:MAG: TetR/AcrR family transcriptional regulator [Burkholderiales bacterium]
MESIKESALEPRWVRRKDARASELIAAALDIFVERGYAATRLEDVAARAGVSKGTVYLYFDNKAELFKAVVREGIVPLIADAEAALSHYQGSSGELLRGLILGWWRSIGQTKLLGIPKLVISEAGNFPEIAKFYADEVISRSHSLMADVLERGMESGEFRRVDMPSLLHLVMSPMVMLSLWQFSFADHCKLDVDPEATLTLHVDMLLRGLAADAPIGD